MGRVSTERKRLEVLRRWRQASVWAPVLWFPLIVYAMLTERPWFAVMLGLAGLFFAGVARLVVWLGRCPRCESKYRESSVAFRRIWDHSTCLACGLSLFELRRKV